MQKIQKLSSTEHEEVFKIIREHDVSFSQNKNGVFFNLTTIPDDIIERIDKMVDFCLSQKDELDNYDYHLKKCKMNNNVQRVDIKQHFEITATKIKKEEDNVIEKLDEQSMEKLATFVGKVRQDREKIGKKKTNMSFLNAKKRYLKKSGERKIEKDLEEDLTVESYLITTTTT